MSSSFEHVHRKAIHSLPRPHEVLNRLTILLKQILPYFWIHRPRERLRREGCMRRYSRDRTAGVIYDSDARGIAELAASSVRTNFAVSWFSICYYRIPDDWLEANLYSATDVTTQRRVARDGLSCVLYGLENAEEGHLRFSLMESTSVRPSLGWMEAQQVPNSDYSYSIAAEGSGRTA